MASLTLPIDQAQKHREVLLSEQRCSECAEKVASTIILNGGNCPHCEIEIGGDIVDQSMALHRVSWNRHRWVIYAGVGVISLILGMLPMLQTLFMIPVMIYVTVRIIRKPVRWLSRGRRLTTRLSIKIFATATQCVNLILNVILIPLPVIGAFLLASSSIIQIFLYCEGSLKLIDRRLSWERNGEDLKVSEWALPIFFIGGTLFVVLIGFGLASLVLHLLLKTEIPGVADIAQFILN